MSWIIFICHDGVFVSWFLACGFFICTPTLHLATHLGFLYSTIGMDLSLDRIGLVVFFLFFRFKAFPFY